MILSLCDEKIKYFSVHLTHKVKLRLLTFTVFVRDVQAGGVEGSGSSGSQSSSSGSGEGAGEQDSGSGEGGVQGEPDRGHREGANQDGGPAAHGAALCKQAVAVMSACARISLST